MNRKPPHKPSLEQQIVGATIGVIFGIGWTVLAVVIGRSSPMGAVGKIFPFFGVVVLCFAVFHLATLLRQLRERKEGKRQPTTLYEENRRERQRKRVSELAGSVVGVLFLLGFLSVARTMGRWLPGKVFFLIGICALFFLGRHIYRLIRDWVNDA